MGLANARARHQAEPDSAGDRALLCRMPGCNSRWTVDIGHGRVCSKHDEALSRAGSRGAGITSAPASVKRLQDAIPLRAPVRPFAEPVDHDEEYVDDYRA